MECLNSDIASIIAKEGFFLFVGSGQSMSPLIRDGIDTVEVRTVTKPLSLGDVILFRQNNQYVLHRIVDFCEGLIIVRGDHNVLCESISTEHVVGVMTALWRGETQVPLNARKYRTYTHLCLQCPSLFRRIKSVFWK